MTRRFLFHTIQILVGLEVKKTLKDIGYPECPDTEYFQLGSSI